MSNICSTAVCEKAICHSAVDHTESSGRQAIKTLVPDYYATPYRLVWNFAATQYLTSIEQRWGSVLDCEESSRSQVQRALVTDFHAPPNGLVWVLPPLNECLAPAPKTSTYTALTLPPGLHQNTKKNSPKLIYNPIMTNCSGSFIFILVRKISNRILQISLTLKDRYIYDKTKNWFPTFSPAL